MAKARVPINGATLRWAREVMNMDLPTLARRCGISPERLSEFETGGKQPTFKQISDLAAVLDRTVAFFFLEPPAQPDFTDTVDFRNGPNMETELPTDLIRQIRRAEEHRDQLLELEGNPTNPLRLEKFNRDSCAAAAQGLRAQLGLDKDFVPATAKGNATFAFWRQQLESHGVLILQTMRVDLREYRGLSLWHQVMPVILINGADAPEAKIFTLFHEVAHLAQRTSGVCIMNFDDNQEGLANAFAAEFLMPRTAVKNFMVNQRNEDPHELASLVSSQFKVSRVAAAVRLFNLGLIDGTALHMIQSEAARKWRESREKMRESKGGPPYPRLQLRNLGSTYVGAVARAIEQERVDILDASYMFDTNVPTAQKVLVAYYQNEAKQ